MSRRKKHKEKPNPPPVSVAGLIGMIGQIGHTLLSAPPSLKSLFRSPSKHGGAGAPGSAPGIEHLPDLHTPPEPDAVRITCIDYSSDKVEIHEYKAADDFLKVPRADWVTTRWVNVDGLHPYVVNQFRQHYHFHTLAAEDILHVPQRPKVETFKDHLFVVIRMMTLQGDHVNAEQISMLLYAKTLVTFQERRGDIWEPIRQRIERPESKLRLHDTSFLLYALLDAVVDNCFPILESYGDQLDAIESSLLLKPRTEDLQRIHFFKRQLVLMRRVLWPLREAVDTLYRNESNMLSDDAHTYMRDVYDHGIQVMDIIETHREMAGNLTDLYMSAVSNKMNEVMKVLTIMASLFIPITFLAGVYGMNFTHMPELDFKWSYPIFWAIVISCTVALLLYFRRKGWLNGSS